jgi:HTH-like domain
VTFAFIDAEKATFPITVLCRALGVSESGFHDWRRRPASARGRADAELVELIRQIHTMSRGTYGSPRVWAELRLGAGIRVGRKRVERLMRCHGLESVYRRRRRGCTRRDPTAEPAEDLVNRQPGHGKPEVVGVVTGDPRTGKAQLRAHDAERRRPANPSLAGRSGVREQVTEIPGGPSARGAGGRRSPSRAGRARPRPQGPAAASR